MKRFFSIITLLLCLSGVVVAQDIVSENSITPRARIAPYHNATLAQTHGGVVVKSQYLRTIDEWKRSEEGDATLFTAQFTVPFSWLSRLSVVHVEGASGAYDVLVNGQKEVIHQMPSLRQSSMQRRLPSRRETQSRFVC